METNLYLILELPLDPPEFPVCDEGKIEDAIKRKRPEWGKMSTGMGEMAQEAKKYISLIPEIRRKAKDPVEWSKESQAAQRLKAEREKEINRKTDEYILMMVRKDKTILKEDLKKTAKMLGVDEAFVHNRIKGKWEVVDSKKKMESGSDGPDIEEIGEVTRKKIEMNLKALGKNDLYDFFGISPTSSLKTLEERGKATYVEWKDKPPSPDREYHVQLVGLCSQVFKTEPHRRGYDQAIKVSRLEELKNLVYVSGGFRKLIEVQNFKRLVVKGVELGASLIEASDFIKKCARDRGYSIEVPDKDPVENMKQCGVCRSLHPSATKICGNCGMDLEVVCPKCETRNTNRAVVCSSGCGFPIGDMSIALPLIKEAKVALINSHEKALFLLKKAEIYWPGHPDIKKSLEKIQSRVNEIRNQVQAIDKASGDGRYYETRRLLHILKANDPTNAALAKEKDVSKKIADAEKWVEKAGRTRNEAEKVDFYQKALGKAADCEQAKRRLSDLPPPQPPRDLQITVETRAVSMKWKKSSSAGALKYRVVRKENSVPSGPMDGKVFPDVTHTLFSDDQIGPGRIYYYSVYAMRGETPSADALHSPPVMRVEDVLELNIVPGDKVNHLSWKQPSMAVKAEVWRMEKICPLKRGEGIELSGVSKDGVLDSGLVNSRCYGYRVIAVYMGLKNGEEIYSKGVSRMSVPQTPPPVIKDLKANKNDGKVDLRWTPPTKGTVILYVSEQSFDFSPGEAIAPEKLSELGRRIVPHTKGHYQHAIDAQIPLYFLPVTLDQGIAVVGKPALIIAIDEISKLSAQLYSGKIIVEWKWPSGVNKVLIAYRYDRFPFSPNDSAATRMDYTKAEYAIKSGFIIQKPEEKDYYFVIYVQAVERKKVLYSSGAQIMVSGSGCIDVYYELKVPRGFFAKDKKLQILLWTKRPTELPELLVIKNRGYPPTKRENGTIIGKIPAGTKVGPDHIAFDITTGELGKKSYAKLFLGDPLYAQRFHLVPQSYDKLELI